MNDKLKRFPLQNAEHRPEACTCETVSDIIGNIAGYPMDAGFNFGASFYLGNIQPADTGLSARLAFDAQIAYGSLPIIAEDFNAIGTSEMYEADFSHYANDDKFNAVLFAQKGVIRLTSYDDIVAYLQQTGWGVGLAVQWFESFATPNQDGTLPAPIGRSSNHMVAVYDSGPLGLQIKDWQHGNYVYMSRSNFGLVFQDCYAFDPHGWRWINLVGSALRYPQAIPKLLPKIISST